MANNDTKVASLRDHSNVSERRVATADLKTGMYVSSLDKPWEDTNYIFQGLHISEDAEIEQLQSECDYVYINIELGIPADKYLDDQDKDLKRICNLPKNDNVYRDTVSVEEELETAREIHKESNVVMTSIMDDVAAQKEVQLSQVQRVVGDLLETVLRNPDASLWMAKLKNKDNYTYNHCVDTCAYAMAFGRHLGLPKEDIKHLGLGGLLFDIGKMRLPSGLLAKPGRLTKEEYLVIRKHVDYSVEIVESIEGIHYDVVAMVQTHHERYDGSGYPGGLKGNNIPVFGRIAAIVDSYDAITSTRPYRKAVTPTEVFRMLYKQRNLGYQDELIEQFIQCLGVYPTGTLVELSTGEVGIIASQNRIRRLRPKVMLILDKNKIAYDDLMSVDLGQKTADDLGQPLEIMASLPPGTYGIDPKEYYL